MIRPTRIALFAVSLVALATMPTTGQAPAGGDAKKLVLVELFTSQG